MLLKGWKRRSDPTRFDPHQSDLKTHFLVHFGPSLGYQNSLKFSRVSSAAASPRYLTRLPPYPPGHHRISAASPSQPPASFGAAPPVGFASRVPRRSRLRRLCSSSAVSASGFLAAGLRVFHLALV
ncbi:hypothetical protein ACOSQ3_027402 [Xanthoceras sorbifolium]